MVKRIRKAGLAALAVMLLPGPAAPTGGAGHGAATRSPPPAGVLWNLTGLPAVFPLQVKTQPGRDYMLTLIDTETGAEAFAAFVKGGAFFKVLVPPGTFRVRFATGDVWQGETHIFGSGRDTQVFDLPEPLTFETRGLSVKAGHVVTLPDGGSQRRTATTVVDQLICQSFRPQFPMPDDTFPVPPALRYAERSERLRDEHDTGPLDHPRYSTPSRRDVRSRYCG